jgi:hypothetical protein
VIAAAAVGGVMLFMAACLAWTVRLIHVGNLVTQDTTPASSG